MNSKSHNGRWSIFFVFGFLVACTSEPDVPLGQEQVKPGEDEIIQSIGALLLGHLEEQYLNKRTLRDTHPKSNGCVKGTLTVHEDISPEYQYGVFQGGKSYPIWMRFSNSVEEITDDEETDFRGLGVKLFNVRGERLSEPGDEFHTQDFLLLGHDGFFAANGEEFFDFFDASFKGQTPWFLVTHLRGAYNLFSGAKRYANPLDVQWNSVSPYALGPKKDDGSYTNVVRYGIRSCGKNKGTILDDPSPDYLEENLQEQLQNGEGCLHFMIQLQTDAKNMPTENTLIRWDQGESPFIKIATIRIPSQIFTSEKQKEFCENLSFNPWHGLEVHRPIGSINRARKSVMKLISDYRLKQNNITRTEPTGMEEF